MRAFALFAVTLASLAGCEGVSEDPLGAGRPSNDPTAGAGSGGDGGVNAGKGGSSGGRGGTAGAGGALGGNGAVGAVGGNGAVGGEGGALGGEGGALGGEGGASAGTSGTLGGEGGANDGAGGTLGGEGGASAGASGTFGGEGGANDGTGGTLGEGGALDGAGGAKGGESGVVGGEGGVASAGGGAPGNIGGEGGSGGSGGASSPVFRRCSPGKPFGPPKRSGIPNGCTRLRLNPDETVGYYGCRHPPRYQVIVATRPDRNSPFGEGTIVHDDAVDDDDYYHPTVTGDGRLLFFERDAGSSFSRIYQSVWDPKLGAFGPVEPALGLGPERPSYGDYSPYVLPSGAVMYFHSNRVWPYEQVFRAAWNGESFSEPERIELQGSRGFPVVSADELTLYYTRNLAGGANTADIWQVVRASTSESFSLHDPTLVQGPNEGGDYNELASFISEDGCRLYFDRDFPGLTTNSYVAERTPDLE